jgi:hypothetical protein
MTAEEYTELFRPMDEEGTLLPPPDTPLGLAQQQGVPAHRRLTIRGADGVTRAIEATAFPLLAHTNEQVGAIAIFWERPERPEA